MRIIPGYLRLAAKAYRVNSQQYCANTVHLALSAELYTAELLAGKYGGVPAGGDAGKVVRSRLKQLINDDAFVSRAAAICVMSKFLADRGLKLDKIRSQGVLFAMLPCWEKAANENRLTELMEDASKLSISKFRKQWNKQRRRSKNSAPTTTLDRVVDWLNSNAEQDEISQVYLVAAEIMENHGNL